jgi:hypothetical protein
MMTCSGVEPGSMLSFPRLEEVKVLEALLATIDERAVVSIALAKIEFAANDIISDARVAANVDALNVDMGPFFNRVDQIDTLVLVVAVLSGPDNCERISALGDQDRQILDRLFDIGIIDVTRRGPQLVMY